MTDNMIEVTILVPSKDINIDAKVLYERETRHHPEALDVTINEIQVPNLMYDIVEYDDSAIDDEVKRQWRDEQ